MSENQLPRRKPQLASDPISDVDWFRLGSFLVGLISVLILAASSKVPPGRTLIAESLANFSLLVALLRSVPLLPPGRAIAIALAALFVPMMELLPLPGVIWQASGVSQFWNSPISEGGWHSLSMRHEVTLASLLWLEACLAIFLSATLLTAGERIRAIQAVIAIAIISAILGIIQGQAGSPTLYLYADAVPGTVTGFFGNRNHQGDFLVIVAGLSSVFIQRRHSVLQNSIATSITVLLLAAAVSTQSRSAVVLFVLVAWGVVFVRLRSRPSLLLGGFGALIVVAVLASFNPVISAALSRFDEVGPASGRILLWTHTQEALGPSMPFGSGMGTFRSVYESLEPLDLVGKTFVNHAHNDALQLLVETGLIGPLALVAVLVMLGLEGRKAIVDRADVVRSTALVCLGAPLLHSFVDYPLRTLAIGALAGTLAAFVFRPPVYRPSSSPDDTTRSAQTNSSITRCHMLACGIVAVFTGFAFVIHTAQSLSEAGRDQAASAIWPFSVDPQLNLASQLIAEPGQSQDALDMAMRVWRRDAFNGRALVIMGLAYIVQNDQSKADAAFEAAAKLGWRDPLVQDYMFARSVDTGAARTAAQAADARLRMTGAEPGTFARMGALLADPGFREALATRLRSAPAWQQQFIASLKPASVEDAQYQALFFGDLSAQLSPEMRQRLSATYLGKIDSAQSLENLVTAWRQALSTGQDPRAGLVDGQFQHLDGRLSPFGWHAQMSDTAKARGGLELKDTGDEKHVVATQFLALPAGGYRVRYQLKAENNDPQGYGIQLRCLSGNRLPVRDTMYQSITPGEINATARFVVKGNACRLQQLDIYVAGGDFTRAPAYVTRIEIESP